MLTHDAIDGTNGTSCTCGAVPLVHDVVCDTVHTVGYDSATQTMRVAFHTGELHDYHDVPTALFRAMLDPHPWSRVGVLVTAHDSTPVVQS
jgi:hypothetical protein